jgi:hypothetical protein
MSSFDSLTLALEDWFDKPLCDLPDALRQRVEEEFFLMPWDRLSAEDRRNIALQIDSYDDPHLESARKYYGDLAERESFLETKIAEWESTPAPTALDLAAKENRLVELRRELAHLRSEVFENGVPVPTLCASSISSKQEADSEGMRFPAGATTPEKPRGSTVRREARKLTTQAMYKQWNKAYRAAVKDRPNMSAIWYSQHIARMSIAKNRNAETIRKHMKS